MDETLDKDRIPSQNRPNLVEDGIFVVQFNGQEPSSAQKRWIEMAKAAGLNIEVEV